MAGNIYSVSIGRMAWGVNGNIADRHIPTGILDLDVRVGRVLKMDALNEQASYIIHGNHLRPMR